MAESTPAELSNGCRNHDPESVGGTGVKAKQQSNSELPEETPAENIDLNNSATDPTRPNLGEKANSFFEERNNRPSTRRWMSLLHRNLAANPGSSQHVG